MQLAKPKSDVYTVMLAISLVAVLFGILCLYLELKAYDFDYKATNARTVPVARLEAPAGSPMQPARSQHA